MDVKTPKGMDVRERAIVLLTQLLDIEERGQVRHVEVADVVDALIEAAAQRTEFDHSRALRQLTNDEARRAIADSLPRGYVKPRPFRSEE